MINERKNGRFLPVLLLWTAALASCTPEPLTYRGPNTGNGHRREAGGTLPESETFLSETDADGQSHLYLSGVRYPDGYDWRKDPQKGSVECTLFLLRDGEPLLELPVGTGYQLASDSDMHRIVRGHLYTEYSTETETIVSKDGEVCYRVPGRERLRGLQVRGSELFTLCESRSGGAWVLRRDGSEYLRGEGSVVHDLAFDDGTLRGSPPLQVPAANRQKLFFATVEEATLCWWMEGRKYGTLACEENQSFFDAGLADGTPWCAYSQSGALVMDVGSYSTLAVKHGSRWMSADGRAGRFWVLYEMEGQLQLRQVEMSPYSFTRLLEMPAEACALAVSPEGEWAVLAKDGTGCRIFSSGRGEELLPEGTEAFPVSFFRFLGNTLYLSLQVEGSPALYIDGTIHIYRFNGCFDGIEQGP